MTRGATARPSLVFGAAVIASHACQVIWLIAAVRVLPDGTLGSALAAQALYGVLQIVVDNGAAFHGARLAARGSLTVEERGLVVRARLELATVCAALGLALAALAGGEMLEAFAPYGVALALFSLLNVWEPYGEGRVGPYAGYLAARSGVVAVVLGGAAAVGAEVPVAVVGGCEIVAVLSVGILARAWSAPSRSGQPPVELWRAIRDVGAPALVTQYTFAVGTIALGLAGRTEPAAINGVATRLLTGLQGLNGIAATTLFPRLARTAPDTRDTEQARAAAAGVVALSLAALAVTAVAAPLLGQLFLEDDSAAVTDALVIALSAAAASGLIMHITFALVARHRERGVAARSAAGAAVTTAVAIAAAISGGPSTAAVTAAGFVAGQILTLGLLLRLASRMSLLDVVSPTAALLAGVAAPAAAIAVVGGGDLALALPVASALAAAIVAVRSRPAPSPTIV